jgi:hypothetical protein
MIRISHKAAVFAIIFAIQIESRANGQTTDQSRLINVESIGRTVTLVGRLGKPLGTKATIEGTWSFPTEIVKDFSARFTVTRVDGKRLERPVEFNVAQLTVMTRNHQNALPAYEQQRSLAGQEWSMIAYETGYIGLIPDEYNDRRSPVFPVVGRPYFTKAFTSKLVAVVTSIDGRTMP